MPSHRATGRPRQVAGVALAVALATASAVAVPAGAQTGGKGFLFREPVVSLSLRGGYAQAIAGSDVFSFATRELTLSRADFGSAAVAGDMSFRLASRVDLSLGAAYSGRSTPSEFRHWVDNDDRPIAQTTDFRRIPVTASLKLYLTPRGRSLGEYAWVPTRIAPYVGAGGGAMWYRFRQVGDFVDFQTHDVFSDRYDSSGWAPTAHAMAGTDVTLTPSLGLTGEVRYGYARGKLGRDFEGFDRIDLSGVSATVGMFVRF